MTFAADGLASPHWNEAEGTLAWSAAVAEVASGGGCAVTLGVRAEAHDLRARTLVSAEVLDAAERGHTALWQDHVSAWSAFWNTSRITAPDDAFDRLYRRARYYAGCSFPTNAATPRGTSSALIGRRIRAL